MRPHLFSYNILDALIAAALLALLVACFQTGGPRAGFFLATIVFGSIFLGYKTGAMHERREAEWAKKNDL